MRSFLRRALRRLGYDLNKVPDSPTLVNFLESRCIDTVLDVGANAGQFAERLRVMGYHGDIVSFEPVDQAFQELQSKAKRDDRWQAKKVALGAAPGLATINVSTFSLFSSFLPLSKTAIVFDPRSAVARCEDVHVVRLDDIFGPYVNKRVFLKIDTQGFERQVLDGARQSLEHIQGLLLELPVVQLYEGNWSLGDALDYLTEAGFVLSQISPEHHLKTDPVSVLELDCVFRRRDSSVD